MLHGDVGLPRRASARMDAHDRAQGPRSFRRDRAGLHEALLDMLARHLDRRRHAVYDLRDRASLHGQAGEVPVSDAQGHRDPDRALLRRVALQVEKTQELLYLGDAARRIVREDELVASGRAALLHPQRHPKLAELRQERRHSMEGGPLLDRHAYTRAPALYAFG